MIARSIYYSYHTARVFLNTYIISGSDFFLDCFMFLPNPEFYILLAWKQFSSQETIGISLRSCVLIL